MTTLRRARLDDMPAVGRLHRHVMRTSLDFLPDLHTAEEDEWFFTQRLYPTNEVWVAEAGGTIVGYIAFKPDFIDHLYVHPEHQDAGLGVRLLELAKAESRMLRLWTFQQNAKARRFYEREGFVAERLTDGADNEERMPDVLYRWERAGV